MTLLLEELEHLATDEIRTSHVESAGLEGRGPAQKEDTICAHLDLNVSGKRAFPQAYRNHKCRSCAWQSIPSSRYRGRRENRKDVNIISFGGRLTRNLPLGCRLLLKTIYSMAGAYLSNDYNVQIVEVWLRCR